MTTSRCKRFFHWQNVGTSMQVMVTHIILQLRLYAMYGSTRKMLIFFLGLTCGEVIILAVGGSLGLRDPRRITTNEPFPNVFICAIAEPHTSQRWSVYFFAVTIFIEAILLVLALRKAWIFRPSVAGFTLMQQLTRDSAMYFFIIFSVYLANLVIWAINRITLNELGVPFAFIFSSIFTNRLLIRVRRAYYVTDDDVSSVPSLLFNDSIPTPAARGEAELRMFNETIGA
ncbi:hypothetical protein C0991_007987 [Blastosporella zonata]|nr:hypothetical protein C0991_007987 [Blastosporella zonata]